MGRLRSLGGVALDVYPSLKGLSSRLQQQADGQFTQAGKRAGQKYGDAVTKEAGGRLKTGLSGVFREAAAPFAGALAGAGVIQGFRSVINAASDAQQSVGGVQAVFKEYANQVIADSRRADQALGLSATQYQELATVTGALLKNQGLSDFETQTKRIIGIGADLAAQYGGTTKDAVEALSSALRGETDPIERYGISLNQSAIQAELLNRGQSKLKGSALITASAQARLAIITRQSADAQGQFAAQADTAAERQQRLTAQLANQRQELGQKLLPAYSGFIGFLNDDAVPAISSTASAIGGLPPEVKAATAAFIAFKVAQGTGVTDKIGSGFTAFGNGVRSVGETLRDVFPEYTRNRNAQIALTASAAEYSPALGRVRSSLNALKPVAVSTGSALARGLSGAVGLLGGPWGIAFAGAAIVATKFYQKQQEAKQRVDALTASLDKQTGAVTQQSVTQAFQTLKQAGAIDAAQKLGISLDTVRQAALGNKDALSLVDRTLKGYIQTQLQYNGAAGGYTTSSSAQSRAATTLRDALGLQNSELAKSRDQWQQQAEFTGRSATATENATTANQDAASSFRDLASQMDTARNAVQKLLDKENERRNANLKNRRDRLGLIQQLQATQQEATNSDRIGEINKQIREAQQQGRERRAELAGDSGYAGSQAAKRIADLERRLREAKKPDQSRSIQEQIANVRVTSGHADAGKQREIAQSYRDEAKAVSELRAQLSEYDRTLNPHTKAGQENLTQLYDLADQWNNTSKSVQNARGEYDQIRAGFVKAAITMGDTRKAANRLADQLLAVPKSKAIQIQTPGLKDAISDLDRLRSLASGQKLRLSQRQKGITQAYATGGLHGGVGTGTSDSNLAWFSRGEYTQRKAAVDHYGVPFMEAVNSLRYPKYANGGLHGASAAPAGGVTTTVVGGTANLLGYVEWVDGGLAIRGAMRHEVNAVSAQSQDHFRAAQLGQGRPQR